MDKEIPTIKEEIKQTIYKKICPYCGVGIISAFEKQLSFNFGVHLSTCDYNPKNKKEAKA